MGKQIVIIGGGISGLAVLHYLKQKYAGRSDVRILLLEKKDRLGGTIDTREIDGCLFEAGPNGFLDKKEETSDFIRALHLEKSLMKAQEAAKIRYIARGHVLYKIPTAPMDFLAFPLLNPLEKIRVLGEFFIPGRPDARESVFDFGARRLGKRFAEVFLDPMVSGIFGGDARRINLKAAFPRMYALEELHGSLFKALRQFSKGKGSAEGKPKGMPMGTLTSFQKGMSQLIAALGSKYKDAVCLNQDVVAIAGREGRYLVHSRGQEFAADHLFLCTPAGVAGEMVNPLSPALAGALKKIDYAPMAVVGLVFRISQFQEPPRGFGYLIPSSENTRVLGVLWDSNIFSGRCPGDMILMRVMIGGARHPGILQMNEEERAALAIQEVRLCLHPRGDPWRVWQTLWPEAIPQYDGPYVATAARIREEAGRLRNFHLVANYLGGISFNDCLASARLAVEALTPLAE